MELIPGSPSKLIPGDSCILTLLRPLIVLKSIVLDCELVGCGLGDSMLKGLVDAR